MTTGEKLAVLRKKKNLTQEQLAEILGVSRQSVSRWEMDVAFPETEKLVKLSRLLECSIDYLLNTDKGTGQNRRSILCTGMLQVHSGMWVLFSGHFLRKPSKTAPYGNDLC